MSQLYWSLGDEIKLWAYVDKVGIDEAYCQFVQAFYQTRDSEKNRQLLFKIGTSIDKIVVKLNQ